MGTSKTIVTVELSQEAQEAAVRAGEPAACSQEYRSDDPAVAAAALDAGGTVDRDGTVYYSAPREVDDVDLTRMPTTVRSWGDDIGGVTVPARPADTLAAIQAIQRATTARHAAILLRRAAIRREEIQRWVALTPEERLGSVIPDGAEDEHADLVALTRAGWERRRQEEQRAAQARRDTEEEQRAAKIRQRAEVRRQIEEWATAQGGHLARLVAEGYDCRGAVLAAVAEGIVAPYDATPIREGSAAWDRYGWEVRESPTEEALDRRAEIAAHVATVPHPACVSVEVLPVQRVTEEPKHDEYDGEEGKAYTAVVVVVECPGLSSRAVVLPIE